MRQAVQPTRQAQDPHGQTHRQGGRNGRHHSTNEQEEEGGHATTTSAAATTPATATTSSTIPHARLESQRASTKSFSNHLGRSSARSRSRRCRRSPLAPSILEQRGISRIRQSLLSWSSTDFGTLTGRTAPTIVFTFCAAEPRSNQSRGRGHYGFSTQIWRVFSSTSAKVKKMFCDFRVDVS